MFSTTLPSTSLPCTWHVPGRVYERRHVPGTSYQPPLEPGRYRPDPDRLRSDWHAALSRTFRVGPDFWVTLSMGPVLHADGSPAWTIHWQPWRPKRMTPELCRLFDAGKARATAEILAAKQTIDREEW